MSPRATAWRAYAQIAATLRERITSGVLASGLWLPPESVLCEEFAVARNTVRRALAELETEGLIRTVPGVGRRVRDPATAAPGDPDEPALPQYKMIAAHLRLQIERGILAPGDPLPSEAALVRRYDVSRGTARQALAELEGAGLAESRQGKRRHVPNRP